MRRQNAALLICFFALYGVRVALSAQLIQESSSQRVAAVEPDSRSDEDGKPEPEELETDRDAFTPATTTITSGLSVLETSYSFIDNRDVAETHSFPETLVRFGILENIELRIGWNYEVGGANAAVSGGGGGQEFERGGLERESQVLYGFKAQLTQQDGWIPRSAVIFQGYTPTSGEAPQTDVVATYVFGWELPNQWRLDSSMRYGTEHGPEDAFNNWAPSVLLRVPLTERWNVHAEYFSITATGSEHDTTHAFFSPGTHYLVTENMELGMRVGWGLNDNSAYFFLNVGIGCRF
jgi:Putative MetA-pathway of phenol degradation